jgi:hypothetical protein
MWAAGSRAEPTTAACDVAISRPRAARRAVATARGTASLTTRTAAFYFLEVNTRLQVELLACQGMPASTSSNGCAAGPGGRSIGTGEARGH